MKKLLTSALLISMSIGAEAALTVPGGLSVIKDWNFDATDSTPWVSNSWASVQNDGGFDRISTDYQQDDLLFVDTSTGTFNYSHEYQDINDGNKQTARSFYLSLGDEMTSGYVDFTALTTRKVGFGTGVYSSKIGLYNDDTLLFELNIRRESEIRYVTGDTPDGKQNSGIDTTGYNNFQMSWENNQISFFFDDAANGSDDQVTVTNEAFIGSFVGGITDIRFQSGTSGGYAETTFDDLYIAGSVAVPEPSTLALAGLAGLTLLARRRR